MKYVIDAINDGKPVRISMYSMNSSSENRVKKTLALILNKYNCGVLLSPLYTCVKELLINAIKANYKNIYFEDFAPNGTDGDGLNYHTALRLFKLEMSREDAKNLERLARRREISADVFFYVDSDILTVTVINPTPMTEKELDKIRQKLIDAESCNDISDYFLIHADDPENEGAGIGLILTAMILRSLGVDLSTLTITCDHAVTRAKLAVPLTYTTIKNYEKNTQSV